MTTPDATPAAPTRSTVSALARSCHPAPCVAVTAFTTVLLALAGKPLGVCALGAVAVLAGQLSIGWSNDRLDRRRDAVAGRADKPIATGEIAVSTVTAAIGAALLVAVIGSLALGWRAGLVHLVAVGFGWSYNYVFKATWWSWLPYLIAFGALPEIATLARPDPAWAPWWAATSAGLLGLAGHFTNVLPDLADDERTGITGFPHRLGARGSLIATAVVLIAATTLLVLGPGRPGPAALVGAGVVLLAVLIAARPAWRNPTSRLSFLAIIAVVAVDLVVLVGRGL